jgi:hypothetical protein
MADIQPAESPIALLLAEGQINRNNIGSALPAINAEIKRAEDAQRKANDEKSKKLAAERKANIISAVTTVIAPMLGGVAGILGAPAGLVGQINKFAPALAKYLPTAITGVEQDPLTTALQGGIFGLQESGRAAEAALGKTKDIFGLSGVATPGATPQDIASFGLTRSGIPETFTIGNEAKEVAGPFNTEIYGKGKIPSSKKMY